MTTPKAKTFGISFKPADLYATAVSYGRDQEPPLNASEVICKFLREGLADAGWVKPKKNSKITTAEARALADARAAGLDPVDILAAAARGQTSVPAVH